MSDIYTDYEYESGDAFQDDYDPYYDDPEIETLEDRY